MPTAAPVAVQASGYGPEEAAAYGYSNPHTDVDPDAVAKPLQVAVGASQ
jgi:hypothetical protein